MTTTAQNEMITSERVREFSRESRGVDLGFSETETGMLVVIPGASDPDAVDMLGGKSGVEFGKTRRCYLDERHMAAWQGLLTDHHSGTTF
jgi:hypothetical protein